MPMLLTVEERELIDNYRAARENARQRIRIITKEAAEVADRFKSKKEGIK